MTEEFVAKIVDAISSLQDTIKQGQAKPSATEPTFDVSAAIQFLVSKKDSIKNRRDLTEVCLLKILYKFYDQLEPSDLVLFHERVKLVSIALQYNWRVAASNATGSVIPGLVVHNTHLLRSPATNASSTSKTTPKTRSTPAGPSSFK